MKEAYEIVLFKFNSNVTLEKQNELMKRIDIIIENLPGLISRDMFYSQEGGLWIDHVKWKSLDEAKKGAELALQDPRMKEVMQNIDESSMIFSHYEKL